MAVGEVRHTKARWGAYTDKNNLFYFVKINFLYQSSEGNVFFVITTTQRMYLKLKIQYLASHCGKAYNYN